MIETKPCRILVVEDEAMVAMLIEDILDELGHDVIGPVSRADRAIELLASVEVDGALLDVNIDGGPSYAIADRLVALERPFVFVTGYGEAGLEPDYRCHPVLQKPFTSDLIAEALAHICREC